jgi:hypothetical protein
LRLRRVRCDENPELNLPSVVHSRLERNSDHGYFSLSPSPLPSPLKGPGS